MHALPGLLGARRGRLHHLPERLRSMGPKRIDRIVRRLEAWSTDPWAAEAIFDVEIFTPAILEPGVGLGNLAKVAMARGYDVACWDIFDWGWPDTRLRDFLKAGRGELPWEDGAEFSVVCNAPFSKTPAFVAHAQLLGARKIAAFQKMEFMGTNVRRPWLDKNPPCRIWLCGTRATCWRFDVPPEKQKGSTPTLHAWFVWERGHEGPPIIRNIWETD